jgi:hypothetical protein
VQIKEALKIDNVNIICWRQCNEAERAKRQETVRRKGKFQIGLP